MVTGSSTMSARKARYEARLKRLSSGSTTPERKASNQFQSYKYNELPISPSPKQKTPRKQSKTINNKWSTRLPKELNPDMGSTGKPLRTVANVGLDRGQCITIAPANCRFPVVLRFEGSVKKLPNNVDIIRAAEMIESGSCDLQDVCRLLKHDRVDSVCDFVGHYLSKKCKLAKFPVMLMKSKYDLSKEALKRLRAEKGDLLDVPFTVESCGGLQDTADPILPLHMLGQRFVNGKAFLKVEGVPAGCAPTYQSIVDTSAAEWINREAMLNYIKARNMRPFAVCHITTTESATGDSDVQVSFNTYSVKSLEGDIFKILGGKNVENEHSDYSLVVSTTPSMLTTTKSTASAHNRKTPTTKTKHNQPNGLFRPPTNAEKFVKLPLSLIEKSIRRGAYLSSQDELKKTVMELLQCDLYVDGRKATELLLWKLLTTIFFDVCPYKSHSDYLSIPQLLGLCILYLAEPDYILPPRLHKKLVETALRLQSYEGAEHTWPWRGWDIKFNSTKQANQQMAKLEAEGSEESSLRNVVRVLSLVDLPIKETERELFKRYLYVGLKPDSSFLHHLRVMPPVPVINAGNRPEQIEETLLASLDHTVLPSITLYLQSCLPTLPENAKQHSLKALHKLTVRLSSGVNVRLMRKQGHNEDGEGLLFRMQQYLVTEKNVKEVKYGKLKVFTSVKDAVNTTKHEDQILSVFFSLQRELKRLYFTQDNFAKVKSTILPKPSQKSKGRKPTPLERRTAFLQLFGRRHFIQLNTKQYSVIIAGTLQHPIKVQYESKYLEATDPIVSKVVNVLVNEVFPHTVEMDCEPPLGFRWAFQSSSKSVLLDLKFGKDSGIVFFVNGVEVKAFDAIPMLEACGKPSRVRQLTPCLRSIVMQILYLHTTDQVELLLSLSTTPIRWNDCDEVFNWYDLAAQSNVPQPIWRDIYLKLAMRHSKDHFQLSINPDQHQQSTYEGTCLRLVLMLCLLYPCAIARTYNTTQLNSVGFKVLSTSNAQFVDLVSKLKDMAFKKAGTKRKRDTSGQQKTTPELTTKLWTHQESAVARVLKGIRSGKRGFADASTVGAGKTLSAISCVVSLSREHGSLVLVPTIGLIDEWLHQVFTHTKGIHVLVQNQQGVLKSKGISTGSHPLSATSAKITQNTIVITTLGRARDHPFNVIGWDFVIIDECLSVQSMSLHSFSAWRQVCASTHGVLLLSATFFRSKLTKLYYMLRMLQSPIPHNTTQHLSTLLHEHVVLHIPKNPRSWKMKQVPIELPPAVERRYRSVVDASSLPYSSSSVGGGDARQVYVALRTFLSKYWDNTTYCMEAIGSVVLDVIQDKTRKRNKMKKRVLAFVNSNKEKKLLVDRLKGDCSVGGLESKDLCSVCVVTVKEAASGLNLQRFNVIVTRPQPGDVLEQMKGRIDRPGQEQNTLELYMVYASNTVEEAEACNVRLCGQFFRHYLHPLSKTFHQRVVQAMRNTRQDKTTLGSVFIKGLKDIYKPLEDDQVAVDSRKLKELVQTTANVKPKRRRTKKPSFDVWLSNAKQQKTMTLDTITTAMAHLSANDARLRNVVSQIGAPTALLSKVGSMDPFSALCRSIVFQQLSVKAASSIFNRFTKLCGGIDKITPAVVLNTTEEALRQCGFSKRKIEYVHGLAEHFQNTKLTRTTLESMNDSEIYNTLIQVRGIGAWSIHMFLIFSMGRQDIFPVNDLVVRKACKLIYNLQPSDDDHVLCNGKHETQVDWLPNEQQLLSVSEVWRPFRSVAVWLLWHAIESDNCTYAY